MFATATPSLTQMALTPVAQAVSTRLVDTLLWGTLVAAFAGGLLRLLPRKSSGTRFAVWFCALLSIAAIGVMGSGWSGAAWSGEADRATSAGHAALMVPSSWAVYLFLAWGFVALVALSRVAAGLFHLRRLRRSCTSVDRALIGPELRLILSRADKERKVALCTSDRVSIATAIGLGSPAIVVPTWMLDELSPADLSQIVLHELAHLRRWDDWTNLVQKIVKVCLFFHPAVWWIERKVSLEREMACDDAVLSHTANPRAYAECLARLAEKSLFHRGIALAQAAIGRLRETTLRVARILDRNRPPAALGWQPAALVAFFGAVCAIGVARAPQLIAFAPEHSEVTALLSAVPALPSASPIVSETSAGTVHPAQAHVAKPPVRSQTRAANVRREPTEPNQAQAGATNAIYQIADRQGPPSLTPLPPAPTAVHWIDRPGPHATGGATEAVFVVVESRSDASGQIVYRTIMWRVTMFHPTDVPSSTISQKKI